MFSLLASLARNRRLLKDFIVRDLKARYVGSSMGFFWSVVFPIINLFVYMFVFRIVLKARWSDYQGPMEVALVMLAGIVVWAAFAETVSRSTNSLVENANLIQKVVFPSEVLPVYLTVSSLINMTIGLPVVLACVFFFAYVSPTTVELTTPGVSQPVAVEEGPDPLIVSAVLTHGVNRDVAVPFIFEGSAQRGIDFDVAGERVLIPSGSLEGQLYVYFLQDHETDPEELVVRLGELEGAKAGKCPSVRVTIADGPPLPEPSQELLPMRAPAAVIPVVDEDHPPYHPLELGLSLICLPLLFLLQVLFTVGIGCFLATLNLFLRDTYHLVGVGVTVWMFGTPIFYPASMVERAGYGWILALNPMHWLIDNYRFVLLYGEWPDWGLLARFSLVAVAVLYLGGRFFMAQKRRFPDLL